MTEVFEKENDYTISVVQESEKAHTSQNSGDKIYYISMLTRTFNFLSAQVTTVKCDRVFQSRNREGGGSAAVSTQMLVENFTDIQGTAEIELMHAKLVELGGKPPAMDSLLTRLNKNRL